MLTEKDHALLSASGSAKWLNCTPSAKLENEVGMEKQKTYTTEGEVAHKLAEIYIRKYITKEDDYIEELEKIKDNEFFCEDMAENVGIYARKIKDIVDNLKNKNIKPIIEVEKKLYYDDYAPCGFGTSDCIIVAGDIGYVIDFKYGIGKLVGIQDNPQLKLYALGLLKEYPSINKICVAIIQPRLNNIQRKIYTKEELLAWGESIKPLAEKAYKGEGEQIEGDYCQFCKIKGVCRERAERNMGLYKDINKNKYTLTNEEISELLDKGADLVKWYQDLQEYATTLLEKGENIEGYTLRNARSTRTFVDKDRAIQKLKNNGISDDVIYETKEKSLAQLEKSIGKKKFNFILDGEITEKKGKLTLTKK